MKFRQQCCWGLRSCVMWRRVVGWVVPDVSKCRGALISKDQQSILLWPNESWRTVRRTAQRHITDVCPLQLNDKPGWIRIYVVKRRWQTFNMTGVYCAGSIHTVSVSGRGFRNAILVLRLTISSSKRAECLSLSVSTPTDNKTASCSQKRDTLHLSSCSNCNSF